MILLKQRGKISPISIEPTKIVPTLNYEFQRSFSKINTNQGQILLSPYVQQTMIDEYKTNYKEK